MEAKLIPRAPLTDDEFLIELEEGKLGSFGHEAKLRAIYLWIVQRQRSSASTEYILNRLKDIEKENSHMSINYFWIHMVDYYMRIAAKHSSEPEKSSLASYFSFLTHDSKSYDVNTDIKLADENVTFADFLRFPHCQPLRNSLLYEKYYSRAVIDDATSAQSFVIPNLKQLPSIVT